MKPINTSASYYAWLNLSCTRSRDTTRSHGVKLWDVARDGERRKWKRADHKSRRAAARIELSQVRMPARKASVQPHAQRAVRQLKGDMRTLAILATRSLMLRQPPFDNTVLAAIPVVSRAGKFLGLAYQRQRRLSA